MAPPHVASDATGGPDMFRSLALALAALSLGACVIVNDGGNDDPNRPDLVLLLTFGGRGCHDAHVSSLNVKFVNGEHGVISSSCTGNAAFEVTIPDLAPATYRLQVTAMDGAEIAYAATYDVVHTIEGTHLNELDVPSATQLVVNLAFAGSQGSKGLTCAEAGVATVKVKAGALEYPEQPCVNADRDAIALSIEPGTYDFTIEAFGADKVKYYGGVVSAQSVNRGANEVTFDLPALMKGGVQFVWATNPPTQCGSAYTVEYVLVDAAGRRITNDPQIASCADGGQLLEPIDAGRYTLTYIRTKNAGGTVLRELRDQRLYAPAGRSQAFSLSLL